MPLALRLLSSLPMLSHARLTAVAEDIENFKKWWEHSETVDTVAIRQGSAALRRLLVEDTAGTAWRQVGFGKTPMLQGPDLLELRPELHRVLIPVRLNIHRLACGRNGDREVKLIESGLHTFKGIVRRCGVISCVRATS